MLRKLYDAAAPFELLPDELEKFPVPQEGSALCLSGGGYKAAAFHLGGLTALNNEGLLSSIERVSSVSGGSIVAAKLGLEWENLTPGSGGSFSNLEERVHQPIRKFLSSSVDISSALFSVVGARYWINPYRRLLDRVLFRGATLQALPDMPRFVINATNMQSGFLWRFMKPRMRDWGVGDFNNPEVRLSKAVMASSAFPPFLSPQLLRIKHKDYSPGKLASVLPVKPGDKIGLIDAGIIDNMGIETAWKKYRTIYVSDGSDQVIPWPKTKFHWYHQIRRSFSITNYSFISMRRKQIIESLKIGYSGSEEGQGRHFGRLGSYWGFGERFLELLRLESDLQRDIKFYLEFPVRLKALGLNEQRIIESVGARLATKSIEMIEARSR